MTQSEDITQSHSWLLPLCATLLTGALMPLTLALATHSGAPEWQWIHEPLRSLILSSGAFAAVLSALFIMLISHAQGGRPHYLWIASALTGMGVLDVFHASGVPISVSVCLHSLSVLIGGLTLALVFLPEQLARLPWLLPLPCLIAAFSFLPGIGSVLFPELLPGDSSGHFPLPVKFINFIGGLGFIAASVYFILREKAGFNIEGLILASSSLLLASSAFFFPFSTPWGATWWLWHILRLLTLLLLFCFFLILCKKDIQILRHNRDELEATRCQLSHLIEYSPSAITLKDLSGRFVLVNKRFEEVFSVDRKDIVGKAAAEVMPYLTRKLREQGEELTEYEESVTLADGTKTFVTFCMPLDGTKEKESFVGCIQTDITEHRRLEQQLKLDRTIIEQAEEAIVITDFEAIILDINEAYTLITGYERSEVLGKNPRINQSGRHEKPFYEEMWRQLINLGTWSGEIWDRRKNGEIFQKWLTINAIKDHNNRTVNYVGVFTDITEKKNIERKLKNLLFYDPLTKLPNRTLFHERLGQAILNSQNHDASLVLFCIDLDRFKDINDSLGHKVGDELLIQVANRIRSGVRKHDIVARLCGDEFTVILSEIKLRESISHLARRMIHLIQQPFYINDEELFVDAGIGISIYPDDGRDTDTLIKNADTALHYAKERERGSFQYFSSQMNQKLVHRIALEKHLRHALDNEEFILHYQPKYALESEAIVGMEALIRWQHPEEGLISPAEFIPIAEESSVITAMGIWCLKTACRQIKDWEREGLGLYRVAVNLSSKQFQSRELLKIIQDTLEETGLAPQFLELEITESTIMEDPGHTVELLHDIRNLGVRIAIDDFGTGYSSLAYLKKFPIHTLKIDQAFIADLTKDSDDAAIVESIVSMARNLNLEVVAEGVETRDQVDFLKKIQCQEAQGYYFSKPLPPEQFSEKLRENKKNTPISS